MDMRTAIKPKKIIPSILHLRPLEITLQSAIRHLQLAICNVAALSTSIMATFLFGQPNFLLGLLGQLQSNSSKLQPKQTCNQMQSKRTKFRVSRVFRVFRLYSFFSSRFFFCVCLLAEKCCGQSNCMQAEKCIRKRIRARQR